MCCFLQALELADSILAKSIKVEIVETQATLDSILKFIRDGRPWSALDGPLYELMKQVDVGVLDLYKGQLKALNENREHPLPAALYPDGTRAIATTLRSQRHRILPSKSQQVIFFDDPGEQKIMSVLRKSMKFERLENPEGLQPFTGMTDSLASLFPVITHNETLMLIAYANPDVLSDFSRVKKYTCESENFVEILSFEPVRVDISSELCFFGYIQGIKHECKLTFANIVGLKIVR